LHPGAPAWDDGLVIFEGLLILCGIAIMAFWVWMLIDCATRESDQGNTKLVWVIIILFANFLGALLYYLVRRPQRWAELQR
jgi:hypothetical protein